MGDKLGGLDAVDQQLQLQVWGLGHNNIFGFLNRALFLGLKLIEESVSKEVEELTWNYNFAVLQQL